MRDNVSKMWQVEISQAPDVRTSARTLDKAEEHAREALAASLSIHANDLHLRHEYHLGENAEEAVVASIEARQKANEAADNAARLTKEVARKLTEELGLSLRDTARIMQLSHQRVSQILTEDALHSMAADVRARLGGGLRLPPQR